jgi:glycosyltransferase involved in cell wall biosynthesis
MTQFSGPRIAIYGDVNANIIDGSSVWLRNISKLCASVPGASVDLFLKARIERHHVIGSLLELENIQILEPSLTTLTGEVQLKPEQVLDEISKADQQLAYTAVILRGFDVCKRAASKNQLSGRLWPYLTDIPQRAVDLSESHRKDIEAVLSASQFMLCQTEEIRAFLGNSLSFDHHKLMLLPPLVSDTSFKAIDSPQRYCDPSVQIFYSGKFAPAWAVEELVDLSSKIDQLSVVIAGDKFQRVPSDPYYRSRLEGKLQSTGGVKWLGAMDQAEIFEQQGTMSIGFAWRRPELDASLELSTKLLEYGAGGLAVITNPTPSHVAILGEGYPLFAADDLQLEQLLRALSGMQEEIKVAAELCQRIAQEYSFSSFQPRWNATFDRVYREPLSERVRPLRIGLAGHDLKFARELIDYFSARVDVDLKIDDWKSLRENDVEKSKTLAEWADVVFCEWCAGNAVWYSENIDVKNTRLFIRFHRIEILMEFAPKLNIDNVEKIFFVGPHFLAQAKEKFSWPKEKLAMLPNFVDVNLYQRDKFSGSEFNLGFIGFVPKLKRLDRALDILKALRLKDRRYRLFIKGRFPWEYPWVWRKPEEKEFYEECLERIKSDPDLKDAVVFEEFGSDISLWLRKIGVILSVSDLESFHMALAEGIASGCYPLLWDREGADELFPWIKAYDDAADIAADLLSENSIAARRFHREKLLDMYDMNKTMSLLDEWLS